jgi:hypothetical protein
LHTSSACYDTNIDGQDAWCVVLHRHTQSSHRMLRLNARLHIHAARRAVANVMSKMQRGRSSNATVWLVLWLKAALLLWPTAAMGLAAPHFRRVARNCAVGTTSLTWMRSRGRRAWWGTLRRPHRARRGPHRRSTVPAVRWWCKTWWGILLVLVLLLMLLPSSRCTLPLVRVWWPTVAVTRERSAVWGAIPTACVGVRTSKRVWRGREGVLTTE